MDFQGTHQYSTYTPLTKIVDCPCTHTLGFLISKMGDHMVPTIRSSKLMNQYAHTKKNQMYPKNDKAKFSSHGYTYATKHNFNSKEPKMKDMLTSWQFHQNNQHHDEPQIYRTNYAKQPETPKESQHISIKQQNGKVQDEFERKKGQEKNNHKYYQRN